MLWMLAREILVLKGKVDRGERGTWFKLDGKVRSHPIDLRVVLKGAVMTFVICA